MTYNNLQQHINSHNIMVIIFDYNDPEITQISLFFNLNTFTCLDFCFNQKNLFSNDF